MKQNVKKPIAYGFTFILLLITEIIIGIYGLGIVRYYIGDLLILPLLYCLIRIFTKVLSRTLPLYLFGVGCIAEILQFFRLSELLGFEKSSLPAILIGTTASWMDVVFYVLGTALIYAAMLLLQKFSAIPQKFRCIVSVLCTIAITIGTVFCWVQMVLTYRFDYDPAWMMGKTLAAVEERYVRYDAQACRNERLENQGYHFIAQNCYFHDHINGAGNFYYLYYVKCDANNIVIDVQIVDTGIGG